MTKDRDWVLSTCSAAVGEETNPNSWLVVFIKKNIGQLMSEQKRWKKNLGEKKQQNTADLELSGRYQDADSDRLKDPWSSPDCIESCPQNKQ